MAKTQPFPLPWAPNGGSPQDFPAESEATNFAASSFTVILRPAALEDRLVLPRLTLGELNRQLSIISRVVIHPKYRTIGLGAKLIRETFRLAGTRYVEMIAVMPKYSPFAEKAGMQKITQQQTVGSVAEVSKTLS